MFVNLIWKVFRKDKKNTENLKKISLRDAGKKKERPNEKVARIARSEPFFR